MDDLQDLITLDNILKSEKAYTSKTYAEKASLESSYFSKQLYEIGNDSNRNIFQAVSVKYSYLV